MAAYVLTIDGVAKPIQEFSLQIDETTNGQNTMRLIVSTNFGTFRPDVGDEVILTEDGVRIFGGHLLKPIEHGVKGQPVRPGETELECVDFNSYAARKFVTETIAAGQTLKQGLQVLETYLTEYGISLDPAQVDGPVFDADQIFDALQLSECLNKWTELTDYLWEIDYDLVFRMFPAGAKVSPHNIVTGNGKYIHDIVVERTRDQYFNSLILKCGHPGVQNTSDSFVANGVDATFHLSFPIVGPAAPGSGAVGQGFVAVDGVNDGALTEIPGYPWLYDGSDPLDPTITRLAGPPPNGSIVFIPYQAQFPFKVLVEDAAEIAAVGTWQKVIEVPEISTKADAEALAASLLAAAISTLTRVKVRSKNLGFHAGQALTIDIADRGIASDTYLIETLSKRSAGRDLVYTDLTAVIGSKFRGSFRDVYVAWLSSGKSGGTGGLVAAGGSSSTGVFVFPNGVELGSVSLTLTDAEIKALPTTAKSFSSVLAVAGGFRVDLVAASLETNLVSAYTNINATFASLFLRWASGRQFTEFVGNDKRTSIGGATVGSIKLEDIATLFGTAGRRTVLLTHWRKAMNLNDWGTLPGIFQVTDAENQTLEVKMDNSGSGDLTGGHASNRLRINVTYLKTPTMP